MGMEYAYQWSIREIGSRYLYWLFTLLIGREGLASSTRGSDACGGLPERWFSISD
jgi:hypothetical protein